ncbi:MAG TPA: (2Fe-2S)-binding protein [Clostridiales bacterium UBA8153]|nr:(2Fe-2S)-binding protein [Clostridiales bacterium UBA8153]
MEPQDEVIICRCEDLTLGDIRRALLCGAATLDEVKRLTRCGMGACQGRTCGMLVAQELARAGSRPLGEIALPRFRPPGKAVLLGSLAAAEREDRGDLHG